MTYAYSPGGLLNNMTDTHGNRTDYLYDPAGRLTEKWLPNGVNTRYQYNPDNTLVQVTNRVNGTVLSQHDYTYDDVGNRMTHTENINGTTTPYIYLYDELNRLKEVRHNTTNGLIESYAYDPLGNRKTRVTGGTTYSYTYNSAQQVTHFYFGILLFGGYVYDANGNLVKKCEVGAITRTDTDCSGNVLTSVTTLTYNALDQLTQATKTGQAPETYVYDPEARRIQKTASTTTNYLYNGPDIQAEYGASWTTPQATYTHGPNWDDPILRSTTTATQYYHQDGLGSITAVTDQTGTTTGSARYNAWGNKLASTGTIPQYGYTGREPDNTGLVYYRARYYDPTTGTFTQRDPIGFNGGINLYTYVGNNPVNYTDPTGNDAFFYHGIAAYQGARKLGWNSWDSIKLGYNVAMQDSRTNSAGDPSAIVQNLHGTGGITDMGAPQTSQERYNGITAALNNPVPGLVNSGIPVTPNNILYSQVHNATDLPNDMHRNGTYEGLDFSGVGSFLTSVVNTAYHLEMDVVMPLLNWGQRVDNAVTAIQANQSGASMGFDYGTGAVYSTPSGSGLQSLSNTTSFGAFSSSSGSSFSGMSSNNYSSGGSSGTYRWK